MYVEVRPANFHIPFNKFRGSHEEWLRLTWTTARDSPYDIRKKEIHREGKATNPPVFYFTSSFYLTTCEYFNDDYYPIPSDEWQRGLLGGIRHYTLVGIEYDPYARL